MSEFGDFAPTEVMPTVLFDVAYNPVSGNYRSGNKLLSLWVRFARRSTGQNLEQYRPERSVDIAEKHGLGRGSQK